VVLLDIHSSSDEAEQKPRIKAMNARVLKRMLGGLYQRSSYTILECNGPALTI
jgi:hypothetical protein